MKNTLNTTLLAAGVFSYLFYDQNAGINFLIFNLLLILLFVFIRPALRGNWRWLWAACLCLVSALNVTLHSSALAVLANLASLLLLGAYAVKQQHSPLVAMFFTVYSVGGSFFHLFRDLSRRNSVPLPDTTKPKRAYRYFMVFMALMFILLFFVVYRQANPLFAEHTNWLNLHFISVPWFLFTLFGFFVCYGLLHGKTIHLIEDFDASLNSASRTFSPGKQADHQTEINIGLFLLIVLNLMLLLLNVGDAQTLLLAGGLPEGLNHADFVHEGVALVILSILIAIALIVFLSRKDFRSLKHVTWLNAAIYVWIVQNLLMLVSTTYRNYLYVQSYNLSQLRIGVYVWLFLAAIGLVFTFLKIKTNRNTWYLVKTNSSAWLLGLVLASCINWDRYITEYNLRHKPLEQVDLWYLADLADSNLPQLLDIAQQPAYRLMEKNGSPEQREFCLLYKRLVNGKIQSYLQRHETGWQSWDLVDQQNMNRIKAEF